MAEKGFEYSSAQDSDATGSGTAEANGSSWQRLKLRARVPVSESTFAPGDLKWSNKDLDPIPPGKCRLLLRYANVLTYL
jgi:hypothetical protein